MFSVKINHGKVYLGLITLLVIFLTLLVPTIRNVIQGSPLSGSETFYHLNNIDAPHNFFDQIIRFFVEHFGETQTVVYLPVVLIVLSLWIFSSIIKPYLDTDSEFYYALLLLSLSPAFLAAHIGLTAMSFILFLSLSTFWLFQNKSYLYLLMLAFLFLVDPVIGFLLSGLLTYLEIKNENLKGAIILIFSTIIFLSVSIIQNINSSIINFDLITLNINEMISFFGARFGFTIILLLLMILGILISEKDMYSKNFLLVLVVIFSLIYEPARIIGLLIVVYFSAKAINFLVRYDWEIKFLKQWILLLIVCLILFSSIMFIQSEIFKSPTRSQIIGLVTLHQQDKFLSDKILAWPSEGEIIRYFSKKNVLESKYRFKSSKQNVKDIFSSREYSFIKNELIKEHVSFIFIDNKVRNFLKGPQEGILFVINHNNNFVKVFELNDVSIYYFKLWDSD